MSCTGRSVGILVWRGGSLLLGERMRGTPGWAPPAGAARYRCSMSDPAAHVRATRQRGRPIVTADLPAEPGEQVLVPPAPPPPATGVTSESLGAPSMVAGSFVAEGGPFAGAGDYVLTTRPACQQVHAPGSSTPLTVLAWPAGYRVRRDVFDALGGHDAPTIPGEVRPPAVD
ncbi:MAG: hypothetical protein ACRDTZ_04630 [Pseudonocardiaceae bacterium]